MVKYSHSYCWYPVNAGYGWNEGVAVVTIAVLILLALAVIF